MFWSTNSGTSKRLNPRFTVILMLCLYPPKLVKIRLKGSITNISLAAEYAPILDAAVTAKDDFFADLQGTVNTITLDGIRFEEVSSSKCLGASFSATGQAVEEIAAKINLACPAFNRLHTLLWSRREISRYTNGRIYESVVRTTLLYGCETSPLRVEGQRRLKISNNGCLCAFCVAVV